jgi:prepilin peptidase CpaA
MGDLKLAVGVGAWIGPSQFWIAFIVTGIVGGIFAVAYAVRRKSLGLCLDRTSGLLFSRAKTGGSPGEFGFKNPAALSIPYAPAIAIGTLFSLFAL